MENRLFYSIQCHAKVTFDRTLAFCPIASYATTFTTIHTNNYTDDHDKNYETSYLFGFALYYFPFAKTCSVIPSTCKL